MFEFVKNWIFKRILNRHRLLFRFWDGRKYVAADPFVLLRRMLVTKKFDLESDLKKLKIPDSKIITERIGYIAEGVREIFDLPPFRPDGKGGLTELECVNLLMQFTGYLERVKKKWRVESDLCANYGDGSIRDGIWRTRRERYERKFGLYLNGGRINFLRAFSISIGIGTVLKGPSKEFLEAICENPLKVNEMLEMVEIEKARAESQ